MSHLQFPRLHFRGDFSANVFTSNNDDLASADPTNQFVDSALVALNTQGMTDTDFARWLREIDPSFGIRAGWNLYGDGRCEFRQTTVHATETSTRQWTDKAAEDPVVGSNVSLRGAVMVDLDPEGTQGTQLFIDQFNLGNLGSMGLVGAPSRAVSRFVSRRNLTMGGFAGFSACWYAAIQPGQLTIQPGSSRTLLELKEAQDRGLGVFVSFVIYALQPKIDQATLASDFALGRATTNPAVGRVIGTIGCWQPAELKTLPQGRRLVSASTISSSHSTFRLNPAIARIDSANQLVTLDLLNTVPEADQTFEKANFGPVQLVLIDNSIPGAAPVTIGPVAYDRTAYEARAGLVDIQYPANLSTWIQQHSLALVQESSGNVLMREQEFTVETDDRCLYLEEGETKTIQLALLQKGTVPGSLVSVDIRQLITTNCTQTAASLSNAVVALTNRVDFPSVSSASLDVTGVRPGTCIVTFLPPGESPTSQQFFINVRVLPRDDFSDLPEHEVTFDFVYDKVLRYYHLLFPAMTQFLDLSDSSAMMDSAQFVIDRIQPAQFGKSSYMPVSRDMSAGKRELLRRWCQLVLDG